MASTIVDTQVENPQVYDKLRSQYKESKELHRSGNGNLPFFAIDDSEYFLSSIIERSEESHALYITTFLLCHFMLTPKPFGHKVHAEHVSHAARSAWTRMMKNVEEVEYTKSGDVKTLSVSFAKMLISLLLPNIVNFLGQRVSTEEYYCKLRHTAASKGYYALGVFMPNNLSPDSNANRRLDVLRCRMEDSEYALKFLARSSASVHVEILRGTQSLINFTVPWETRRTGYLLSSPSWATRFDPWKGLDPYENVQALNHVNVSSHSSEVSRDIDKLYLCAPGLESIPNRKNLALYLEFVQHHLLQGVQHVFLSVSYAWDSEHMKNLTRAFRSYIDEGTVSISSQSGDEIDFVYSFSGMSWGRDNVKNFAANMYLYLSKGTAKYMGIWDFDEFFIPKYPYKSILDIISLYTDESSEIGSSQIMDKNELDILETKWETTSRMADCNPHPW